MTFSPSDVPILLVFGQSNAHGHAQPMPENERITSPLPNVWGLRQPENQSYDLLQPVWTHYTSDGTNLGEIQEHTLCLPNLFAKLWQERCPPLPDLRIIRISIGAQGVTRSFMWNPDHPKVLIPGPLGTVDLALYPLACRVLQSVVRDLRNQGKTPRILALHWLGGEEETGVDPKELTGLTELYVRIFNGFFEAAGGSFPLRLYKILGKRRSAAQGEPPGNIDRINKTFEELTRLFPDTRLISAENFPGWNPQDDQYGLFCGDGVHYTGAVQQWFAETAFDEILSRP